MLSGEREQKPIYGRFQIPTSGGVIDISINSGLIFQGDELLESFAHRPSSSPIIEAAIDRLQKATQNLKPNAIPSLLLKRQRTDARYRSQFPLLGRIVPSEIPLAGEIATIFRILQHVGIRQEENLADLDDITILNINTRLIGSKRLEIVLALRNLARAALNQQD